MSTPAPNNWTPRTDKACWMQDWEGYRGEIVNSNFARQLERELNEAKTLIQSTVGGLYHLANVAHDGVATITDEQRQGWHDLETRMKELLKRTEAQQ